jgi:hypothetical protein
VVSVFVMPLQTWLAGNFRTTWGVGEETASAPRRRRRDDDAAALRDTLIAQLAPLVGSRPEWNESGPAQSAVAVSAESFALPFLLARRWSARLPLPNLSTLEGPQIWLPVEFRGILCSAPPWSESEEETLAVASLPALRRELERLLETLRAEEELEAQDLRGAFQVGMRLLEVARTASEVRMPVIIEG